MNSTLLFQQIDIDYYTQNSETFFRLYGRTENGKSVLLHVHGFHHYFYLRAPKISFSISECKRFLNELLNCETVQNIEHVQKYSLYGYNDGDNFLKITTSHPAEVKRAASIIEISQTIFGHEVFESNIDFQTRFMVDANIVGCNWIEIPNNKYMQRITKTSTCDIECDVFYGDIISYSPEEKSAVAPFRILSFDIEVAGRKGIFPEAEIDPIIQIASVLCIESIEQRFVFTLNTCDEIENVTVNSFDTEYKLLMAWNKFVRDVDPDIIIGYNIKNFDFHYMICRAKFLKCFQFLYLGRIRNSASKTYVTQQHSKQTGSRNSRETIINGRCQLDLYQIISRDYKLRCNTLNFVSKYFLNEQKEDVHYTQISDLHAGNSSTRQKLAKYCLQDSVLPLKLMNKLMIFINYMEMARVTGVTMQSLFVRGQQIKIVSQLLRKCKTQNYIIPSVKTTKIEEYTGALVIEPKKGYYDEPIVTLDFASLYPSIMMAHNLCYTTLLSIQQAKLMNPNDYIKTPSGSLFAKKHIRKGILPEILENLLAARQKAKLDLKRETDLFKKSVLDGRQLALKITANSVYGFTGAQIGFLPCLQISESVTAFGREMISETKNQIENKYCVRNGYKCDAIVIYGDTDSVMVKFGIKTISEAIEYGKEAALFVSEKFSAPIKLEFEKVYHPYLLINKKKYAGLYYTSPNNYDKMDCKGIETVRREFCPLVVNILSECLRKILIERDPEGAVEYSKKCVADIKSNTVDISQLVLTREIRKSDYKVKQPHVELAKRIESRDPGTGPKLGDRVQYVVIASQNKKRKLYERVEDPIFVQQKNIPIDVNYYVQKQIAKPLKRIFEVIIGETRAKDVFTLKKQNTLYSYFKREDKKCLKVKDHISALDNISALVDTMP